MPKRRTKQLQSSLRLALLLMIPIPAMAEVPSFAEVKSGFVSSEGRLLDRHGRLLQELRLRSDGRALEWTVFEELSPAFVSALLEVEDKRFFRHSGVDLLAVGGAVAGVIKGEGLRGASTITMQLVKLLGELDHKNRRRTFWEKVRQARLAWELEEKWSKREILEAYTNLVGFRGEQRGVSAASRALFGKEAHGLDRRESLLLAVLLQLPSAAPKRLAERICAVAASECEGAEAWVRETLSSGGRNVRHPDLAPHLARKLLSPGHPVVKSTLDAGLQSYAQEAVEEQLAALATQNVRDAAVVALDNKTGAVLVYVGSSRARSASPAVDMALATRQAGSTLKPFLYGTAFEQGLLGPDSWLLDEPFELNMERGSYRPGNYDGGFHGPVRAREALGSSLNVPAVRVYELVGGPAFHRRLEQAGMTLKVPEHYGPSLALGTADLSLLELTNAYRALANGGRWSPVRFSEQKNTPTRKVFSAKTAGLVSAILADRGSRALSFGWDSLLATPFPAAVKTGTSKDMRDNWCIGYTRDFSVGVWVGNGAGDPMWQVSGIEGAAPIWRALITKLEAGRPVKSFPPLPKSESVFTRTSFARIRYPQHGAIIALDPDIPDSRELVPLEAEGDGEFFVDGTPAKEFWAPTRGRHRISLRQGDKLLDEIGIEVR